jgi:hypothetical protein
MRIDINKLPIKYALELYQELPSYPSPEDLEYLLVSALQEKDLLGVEFTAEQVWDYMKIAVATMKELRIFLDSLEFCDKVDDDSYLLSKHPWMN